MTLTLMAHSQSCQTCIPLKLKKKILFGMSFNVAHGDYLEIPGCFKLHHFNLYFISHSHRTTGIVWNQIQSTGIHCCCP